MIIRCYRSVNSDTLRFSEHGSGSRWSEAWLISFTFGLAKPGCLLWFAETRSGFVKQELARGNSQRVTWRGRGEPAQSSAKAAGMQTPVWLMILHYHVWLRQLLFAEGSAHPHEQACSCRLDSSGPDDGHRR